MGSTTFSGPVKAGTISSTTGTTLGTDIKNTGQVVMAQTFSTGTTLSSGASTANATDVVIPANSQIIDIILDKPTAMGNATCVFSVGDTVGGNKTFINRNLVPLNKILKHQDSPLFGLNLISI